MSSNDTQLEERLARRAQRGDDDAFDRLVELCAPRVFQLAYRMLGQRDDADDIAQEAFVRVYRSLPKFNWEATFSTWLYRITTNLCVDEIKRRRRRPLSLDQLVDDDASTATAPHESAEDAWARREEQQSIQQALTQLPPDFRLVIVLADVRGMSYQEIADVLRINIGTVKSRLNRARHLLREYLSKESEMPASRAPVMNDRS